MIFRQTLQSSGKIVLRIFPYKTNHGFREIHIIAMKLG